MKPRLIMVLLGLGAMSLGGCGPLKLPRFPKPVQAPSVKVSEVKLVATGAQATRFDVLVVLENPNDVALPLDSAEYRFSIHGRSYESEILPNVVLPRGGSVGFYLPAVLTGPDVAGGGPYSTSATITYTPPGELRRILYDMGLPKPKVNLTASGATGQAAAR